jgi:hypothetical protein
MTETASGVLPVTSARVKIREGFLAGRTTLYIGLVVLASLAGLAYQLRSQAIFACPANEYGADRYLAYCHGEGYADYEHGAFYFRLEPSIYHFVRNADVLFLGNSRLQVGFSTAATADWFTNSLYSYYLMGFSYFENATFAEKLMRRIEPRARVYVINIDDFFSRSESPPVKTILHDPDARNRYEVKRLLQPIHEWICGSFGPLCGHKFVVFRSRETGAYLTEGAAAQKVTTVSYDRHIDQEAIGRQTAVAIDFLSQFGRGKCIILTMVPFVGTKLEDAKAIARNLGMTLITPDVRDDLETYDGYHLDQPSAQRWSQAFFQAAGPEIRSCLEKQSAARP